MLLIRNFTKQLIFWLLSKYWIMNLSTSSKWGYMSCKCKEAFRCKLKERVEPCCTVSVDRVFLLNSKFSSSLSSIQTIVSAMTSLTPPCQLACPANQCRIDYVMNQANQKDFEFPSVSCTFTSSRSIDALTSALVFFLLSTASHILY